MIHYYFGDGKGKTTAAMGLALRAAGWGKRVFIVQFLKNTPSGEVMFFEHITNVTLVRGKAGKGFTFNMTEDERLETVRIHNENLQKGFEAVQKRACDMLILDEVGDAFSLDLIDRGVLLRFLEDQGSDVEIVMTGHIPVEALVTLSDYVTVMKKEKHPYDRQIHARKSIEY